MPENYTVTIIGSLAQEWMDVFGTNAVPIDPPIPVALEQHDGSRIGAFMVDLGRLTRKQQGRIVKHLAGKYELPIPKVKELLRVDGLPVSAEHCIMRRVTKHQIDLIRQGFRENYLPRHPEVGGRVEALMIAKEIISFMLGHDWWVKNVFDELGRNVERMGYLRLGLATEQERLKAEDRIIDLADSLFLLQDCEGFDSKIEDLRRISPAKPHVVLEDTAIELQVAKMLVKSGHEIEFMARSMRQREDYDLKIKLGEGIDLSAEIKCRREDTPANISSLRRRMNRAARKQLPEDNPSILFVRLPSHRVKDTTFVSKAGKFIHSFFGRFPFVNAVVLVWEEWVELPSNLTACLLKYQPELNPSPRYSVAGLSKLLASVRNIPWARGAFLSLSFGDFNPQPAPVSAIFFAVGFLLVWGVKVAFDIGP